jgi:Mrp family chromosome partitioning ATPase/uncharacterized protein involved in exopolysaccharide biosynthesis
MAAACLDINLTEKTIILPPDPAANGHDANYRLTVMTPKRRYLSYLRERWWVVMVCLVLTVGTTLVYETVRTPTYGSQAALLVGDMHVNMGNFFSEEAQTYYGTQIEMLKSSRLQNDAFERAGGGAADDEKNLVSVDVARPMGTSILRLQVTGENPDFTERYLNSLITVYTNYKAATRRDTSQGLVDTLQEQLKESDAALQGEQDKWVEFQKTNNIAALEEEGKSAGLYLASLNLELAKLKLERQLLRDGLSPFGNPSTNSANPPATASGTAPDTNALATAGGDGLAANLISASGDADLRQARRDLAVLKSQKEEKAKILQDRRQEKIGELEKLISVLEEQNLAERKLELRDSEKRAEAIESVLPHWETNVLAINGRLSESQRLKNNIQRAQGYYDHLLAILQNAGLSQNVEQERLSILEPPTRAKPALRYLPIRIALAVAAGLALSLAVVFAWHLLDDRFVSVRDIKDQFGESVLGLVPQVRISRSKPQDGLLQPGDSRQPYAESYRHLRSALLLASGSEGRPQTILLTSAVRGEGKTTIAVNLARVLCRSGLRVALVDADRRGPGLHKLVSGQAHPGLLDYLRGGLAARSFMQTTAEPGLTFVSLGAEPQTEEGLFVRPRLADLIKELRQGHDFVILDGAPILAADDTALLAPYADLVVLVARPFFSKSQLIRRCLDMLYQRQVKQVAFILNRARPDDVAGHYSNLGNMAGIKS